MNHKIPISVIIVTKNEAARITRCLSALARFDNIWVLDSNSTDNTQVLARRAGAKVVTYTWNGAYPKKRGWALDHLPLVHEHVLFVDGDEILPPALVDEIAALDWRHAGYFIKGRTLFNGRLLRHGLHNNKLVLFDRRKIMFPVVDDLGLEGMGEIEGHYQPVLRPEYSGESLGQLENFMIHDAYDDQNGWEERHKRYALWEVGMNARNAWPKDPRFLRQCLKVLFRHCPRRDIVAFIHSYILKCGFLDGRAGLDFAKTRAQYYRMIKDLTRQ